jgi:hypothetical protein
MSIELFAGKSNIFESNQRPGKILSEIYPSPAVPQDRKLSTDKDLQSMPTPNRKDMRSEYSWISVSRTRRTAPILFDLKKPAPTT